MRKPESAGAFVAHWKLVAEKGLMNPSTANGRAAACRTILCIESEWEMLDVRTLDEEDLIARFKNLRHESYTPRTLGDYESKFRRAIRSYREYLKDPAKWKPSSRPRTHRPVRSDATGPHGSHGRSVSDDAGVGASTLPDEVQEYVYPFRAGVLAKLSIPRDATTEEVGRLVAWAQTLAVDYKPQP